MFEVIMLLFDICLFKKSPQDLPYSVWLLRLLIVIDVIVSFLMISLHAGWAVSLLQAVAGALLLVGFSWLMLYVARKWGRFYQTASALLGTDAMISFLALPGMASMSIGVGAWLAFAITIALMIWHWLVTGYIFRNALEQSWTFSLGLAFLYILGSYQVMALLFPEVTGVK
ncbi:hypothetical protein [Candidatus Methylobacter oryzae]|uniref:Yip1 domain-containing protein n=1 Tax=Candidatus Methylobacter oryzae TaxID=2497749 RepID=A0ABY3CH64_9GAMM|nr:hypothetical protein [Candidatus Methylobacter oryzae]TRX03558.1 hypothetical protein EKO24_000220 [Candidatus Methylobacter oryzae]